LALPTLFQVIINVVLLVVGVPIVYLLSKGLKLRPKPITIAEPRKEATLVSVVIISAFVIFNALRVFRRAFLADVFQFTRVPPVFGVVDVLWGAFFEAMVLLPVFLGMKRTGQSLGSVGINGKDAGRMVALGLILSAILIAVLGFIAPYAGGGFAGFSSSLAFAFIFYAILGFSEEVIWRGYSQTRLTAYMGTLKGLVVTSLLFAILWHFTFVDSSVYQSSGVALAALASAFLRFFSGMLFGYIMLRSQNIIPSYILHLFMLWSFVFWQIPSF